MNESEGKKEYELKKQQKQQQKDVLGKKDRGGKAGKKALWLLIAAIILVLVFLGLKSIVKNNTPMGEDLSQGVQDAGRQHIAVGTIPTEGTYSSNPPSSGPHYPSTIRGKFYDTNEPIEDQFVLHNLEHGDLWITYHPRIGDNAKEVLKGFAGRFLVVSPREDNETDISLVGWGRIDSFNESDLTEERVKDFILRYDNKGPEQVRGGGQPSFN